MRFITSLSYCLFILFVLVLTSCRTEHVKNDLIFRYNQASGLTSLDPAFARNQANIWAVNQFFNGLVQLNDKLEVIPCIAKRWIYNEDGTSITFFLRDDVYFHNHFLFEDILSRKVTAHDFVYSLHRIIDPKVASPGAWIFNEKVDSTHPFVAIDDTTFQIRLSKPFQPIMGILTMPYCFVVPKVVVEYYGKEIREHPVGTGPFYFKIWEDGVALVGLRNERYFEEKDGKTLPYLDGFRISFVDNKKIEFLNFLKGDIDFVSGIDKSYMYDLLDEEGMLTPAWKDSIQLLRSPYLNTEYLGFLLETKNNDPIYSKHIRKSINYSFDRSEMLHYLRRGIGIPATGGMIPPGLPGFNTKEAIGYDYDPEKAALYLDTAGFPGGKGLREIVLYSNETYKDFALYIVSQAGRIGIPMRVEIVQPSILREWMVQGEVGFFRGSWIADYPDAENYLSLFYGPHSAPPNYTRFSNEKYDSLYTRSLIENVDSLRYELYRQMDRIIVEEAPVVPLFYDEVIRLTHPHISGLEPNALNLLDLKYVKKDL